MTAQLPKKVKELRAALLDNPGRTTPELRKSIEATAAAMSGRPPPAGDVPDDVPDDLGAYIEKVTRWAYKITDEDIESLKAAGYTEDELFEITLSAAMGASLARMERGLLALNGGK